MSFFLTLTWRHTLTLYMTGMVMDKFSVNQLAKITGVSVRTLHHYDEIDLLKPATRTDAGYRYYGREELLRLQQILFYRELDIPLADIREILDDEQFDVLTAMESHRKELQKRIAHYGTLLETIDHTIANLKNEKMNYEEMYKGFSKEQVEEWEKEVIERWGADKLDESKRNIMAMTKAEVTALKEEGEQINLALVTLIDKDPADAAVQQLVARHYAWINKFYACPIKMYRGFGDMYVHDERYRATYEQYAKELPDFLKKAMDVFCDEHQAS